MPPFVNPPQLSSTAAIPEGERGKVGDIQGKRGSLRRESVPLAGERAFGGREGALDGREGVLQGSERRIDKGCATSVQFAFSSGQEAHFVGLAAGYVDKSGKNRWNAKAKRGRTSRYAGRLLPLTSEGGTLPTRFPPKLSRRRFPAAFSPAYGRRPPLDSASP